MPQEETSYFEKCVGALPAEKRDAARAAFREIADTGEDSYLSKLLAVLEANNAYAKTIPAELAAVHDKFLADLGREARRIREEQRTAETSRDAELHALLHREVQQLDKTLPLTHVIDAIREQNRQLEQLRPAILKGPLQFDVLLGGIAGLILIGRSEETQQRLPHAQWQFFRMQSDTDYDQAERGTDCLAICLRRLRELINAYNPIVTIAGQLVHAEFPRYPLLALRELLVNALVHRDYSVAGNVTVKLYPDRLEIANPRSFLGGITPENILHHPSTPRYPTLFQALARIRLANAANLGVPRVFRELLIEGKEPPYYSTDVHVVVVTVKGQDARREFVEVVRAHPELGVD